MFGTVNWLALAPFSAAIYSAVFMYVGVPVRRFTTLMIMATGASNVSAVLVTGFLTIVKVVGEVVTTGVGIAESLTPPYASNFTVAVTITGTVYVITLTHAPLLMLLEKFQNVIIISFVRHHSGGVSATLAEPLGVLAAFGTFDAGLVWLIGP